MPPERKAPSGTSEIMREIIARQVFEAKQPAGDRRAFGVFIGVHFGNDPEDPEVQACVRLGFTSLLYAEAVGRLSAAGSVIHCCGLNAAEHIVPLHVPATTC